MLKIPCIFALIFLSLIGVSATAEESALAEAKKLTGHYVGRFVMYGIEKNQVVVKSRWSESLMAKEPVESSDRVIVDIEDVLSFEGGNTKVLNFKEGYLANPDGSAGERFYDVGGETLFIKKLNDKNWSYYSKPSNEELVELGFDPAKVAFASHVTVKTLTEVNGKVTEHVTRVTTVQYLDASGLVQTPQFLSLMGIRTKQP